jgi:hypothetical protein
MGYEIGIYDPCPCGSGKKYKFCCAAAAKESRHGRFPIGTVAHYGPDDRTTTKIAACVILREESDPIIERWVGTNVVGDAKVVDEIKRFFAKHGVKSIVVTDGNMGCPHEEGLDFPRGRDCPFCPFWAGKQGTARRDDVDDSDWDDDDDAEVEQEQELEQDESEEEERDSDAAFARMEAVLGDRELDRGEAVDLVAEHLKARLSLPCEVTGSEDFQWEERYVIGGWDPREYKRLKKTQPSYTDRYQLLSIDREGDSEWMMFGDEDICARVRRISDGKEFVLGLAELKAADRKSANHQLLDDYAVWFVNSR